MQIITKKYAAFVKISPEELTLIREEEEQNAEQQLTGQIEQVQQATQQIQQAPAPQINPNQQ